MATPSGMARADALESRQPLPSTQLASRRRANRRPPRLAQYTSSRTPARLQQPAISRPASADTGRNPPADRTASGSRRSTRRDASSRSAQGPIDEARRGRHAARGHRGHEAHPPAGLFGPMELASPHRRRLVDHLDHRSHHRFDGGDRLRRGASPIGGVDRDGQPWEPAAERQLGHSAGRPAIAAASPCGPHAAGRITVVVRRSRTGVRGEPVSTPSWRNSPSMSASSAVSMASSGRHMAIKQCRGVSRPPASCAAAAGHSDHGHVQARGVVMLSSISPSVQPESGCRMSAAISTHGFEYEPPGRHPGIGEREGFGVQNDVVVERRVEVDQSAAPTAPAAHDAACSPRRPAWPARRAGGDPCSSSMARRETAPARGARRSAPSSRTARGQQITAGMKRSNSIAPIELPPPTLIRAASDRRRAMMIPVRLNGRIGLCSGRCPGGQPAGRSHEQCSITRTSGPRPRSPTVNPWWSPNLECRMVAGNSFTPAHAAARFSGASYNRFNGANDQRCGVIL